MFKQFRSYFFEDQYNKFIIVHDFYISESIYINFGVSDFLKLV